MNHGALSQIPKIDKEVFKKVLKISGLVNAYETTHEQRPVYRCHSVSRAVAHHVPELKVMDGVVAGVGGFRRRKNKPPLIKATYFPHTWLIGPGGTIIDPYPVGIISKPVLVLSCTCHGPYGKGLYFACPDLEKRWMTPEVLEETKILIEHIGKLLAEHKQ